MAVPKSKVSKQRRNKRRSSVWKLETPGVTTCPKCGAFRLPHRMCKSCINFFFEVAIYFDFIVH